MEDFKVAQFTKVLVTTVIRDAADPCVAAADQVKGVLMVALKNASTSGMAWKRVVEDACQGGMVALLLSKKNLAAGAVAILKTCAQAASELNLDSTQMQEGVLNGIADMHRFMAPEDVFQIQDEIKKHDPSAEQPFAEALRRAMLRARQAVNSDKPRT